MNWALSCLLAVSIFVTAPLGAEAQPVQARDANILGVDHYGALLGTIQSNQSAAIMLQGDSTGDEEIEWFGLLRDSLAVSLQNITIDTVSQNARVEYKAWNSGTQDYGPWSVIQAGTYGERYDRFDAPPGGRSRRLTTLDIPNPPAEDWDIRIKVALDDWTPATLSTIFARQGGVLDRGYTWTVQTNGDIKFTWFPNSGSESNNVLTATAANLAPMVDGSAHWLRFTLVISTGVATMYKCSDEVTCSSVATSTVGATTVGNPSAAVAYEIGGRSNNVEVCTCNIYKFELRDGIDGPLLNPETMEAWGTANASAQGGSPTLFVINGSESGKGLDWFIDAARFPKMVRNFYPSILYLSTSHNDGLYRGMQLAGKLDTWLSLARARVYFGTFSIALQNPEISPASAPLNHLGRTREMYAWAQRNNLLIGPDATRSFYRSSLGLSLLSKPDGVHPSYAYGAPLWGQTENGKYIARSHK